MRILALLCMLSVCYGKMTIWRDGSSIPADVTLDVEIGSTPLDWWDAAYTGCGEGWLYSPKAAVEREALKDKMEIGDKYWIGGVQSLRWKWTADDTSFTTYRGYLSFADAGNVSKTIFQKNSAQTCQDKCTFLFGLKGEQCFCIEADISKFNYLNYRLDEAEMRCPGSYDDRCGNSKGMSVYYADVHTPIPSVYVSHYTSTTNEEAECAFVWCTAQMVFAAGITGTADCQQRMGYTCDNVFYNHDDNRTWESASRQCTLAKMEYGRFYFGTRSSLCQTHTPNYKRSMKSWLGLTTEKTWKWLDGSDITGIIRENSTVGRGCLALEKNTNQDIILTRENCSLMLPQICEKENLPKIQTCKEADVMVAIAHQQVVTDSKAGKCTDGRHDRPEALLTAFCGAKLTATWRPGGKVVDMCSTLPLHSPIATFQLGYYVQNDNGLAGIFLGCTPSGFTMAVQMCGQPPRIVEVTKGQANGFAGNAENYHVVTYRDYSSQPIIG